MIPQCHNNCNVIFILLQLKAIIQRNSFNPILDNTYSAKSGQNLSDILDNSIHVAVIAMVMFYQLLIFILIISIIAAAYLYFTNVHNNWFSKLTVKSNKKTEAFLISVAVIGIIQSLYIVILDMLAMYYNYRIDSRSMLENFNGELHYVSIMVFLMDIFSYIIVVVLYFIVKSSKCQKKANKTCKYICTFTCTCTCNRNHTSLAITFSCITILVNHFPFITIGYLNDAYHAGSIFIFYVFSFLLLLSVFEILVYTILTKIVPIEYTDIRIICEGSSLTCSLCEQEDGNGDVISNKHSVQDRTIPTATYGTIQDIEQDPQKDTTQCSVKGTNPIESRVQIPPESVKEDFLIVNTEVVLEFEKSTDSTVQVSGELTVRLGKVVTGKITDVCVNFPTEHLNDLKDKRKSLKTDDEFDLQLQLTLNNDSEQISASGKCKNKSLKIEENKLKIAEIGLLNEFNPHCEPCIIASICVIIVCTLLGIIFTAAYLVLIPINRSISDAPNRLIGVYQTIFLLLGIYIGYKTFFKRKISLQSVVENSVKSLSSNKDIDDKRWCSMSKEERLVEFYRSEAEFYKYKKEN